MTDVVHPQQHIAGHHQHPQAAHAGPSGLGHHHNGSSSSHHLPYPHQTHHQQGYHQPNGSSPGLSPGPASATASSSALSLPASSSAAAGGSGLHNPYGVLPPGAF
jgi:hypothetical protein